MKKIYRIIIMITLILTLVGCDFSHKEPIIEIQENSDIEISVGSEYQIKYIALHITSDLIWESSNPECVKVDKGIVTGVSDGESIISLTSLDFSQSIKVIVTSPKLLSIKIITMEEIMVDDELSLMINTVPSNYKLKEKVKYEIVNGNEYASLNDNKLTALKEGYVTIKATVENQETSSTIKIIDFNHQEEPLKITIEVENNEINIGESTFIYYNVNNESNTKYDITFECISNNDIISLINNEIKGLKEGTATVIGRIESYISNEIIITIKDLNVDPYLYLSEKDFYQNYKPASSNMDAYYRSLHYLMSGSIEDQDQKPTISSYQPMENGLFVRNSSSFYSDDKKTYYVVDCYGNVCNKVFYDGAYVTLEEVAAYVYAFGNVPQNYVSDRNESPSESEWNIWLRCNNTYYSGDTSSYPYEPILPNIQGAGGTFAYYEIDIGTTGTDCDPNYDTKVYNNGKFITRGAARIVYSRFYENESHIDNLDDRYVFYTYNHYNDFQEYLNYQGGWGEIFGNITGGGSISSRKDYNPTDYVKVVRKDFYSTGNEVNNINSFTYFDISLFDKNYFELV